MSKDSKDKNLDFIKRSELLNGMKRYFGIDSQEEDDDFQRYIKRYTNLPNEDKSIED